MKQSDMLDNENFPPEAKKLMEERFGKDCLIALATVKDNKPYVRAVNSYYENGCFYVITHGLSNKMQQIKENPDVSICGEWFTANGTGENLGYICSEENSLLADKLRRVFSQWYYNGHTDESDYNTCILKIKLTDGLLLCHGTRYAIIFSQ